ncbi:hypothetical protein DRN73_07280 [Candidatus Pacearchaeota archaeon]|nr:MAG: hypothetical protein DRN73_07280 [Candidatus Pacearchaeota archaeon]
MEIQKIQEEAWEILNSYNKKNGIEHNKDTVFYHLIEEVGELAREIQKEKNDWRKEGFDKKKLSEELVDILVQLLYLAKDYNIDIVEAFNKKVKKLKQRYELE